MNMFLLLLFEFIPINRHICKMWLRLLLRNIREKKRMWYHVSVYGAAEALFIRRKILVLCRREGAIINLREGNEFFCAVFLDERHEYHSLVVRLYLCNSIVCTAKSVRFMFMFWGVNQLWCNCLLNMRLLTWEHYYFLHFFFFKESFVHQKMSRSVVLTAERSKWLG